MSIINQSEQENAAAAHKIEHLKSLQHVTRVGSAGLRAGAIRGSSTQPRAGI